MKGELETAEDIIRQAIEGFTKLGGAEHPDIIHCTADLERILHMKRLENAISTSG